MGWPRGEGLSPEGGGHHYGGLKRERKIRKGVFCEDGENRAGVKGALNFVNGC